MKIAGEAGHVIRQHIDFGRGKIICLDNVVRTSICSSKTFDLFVERSNTHHLGNNLGTKYWQTILEEHGIDTSGFYYGSDPHQLERIHTCFHEVLGGKYVPRAILVDLDPNVLTAIQSSSLGALFTPENFICGQYGANNNWAKGFYTEGMELLDIVMESSRKEAESCDSFQGFQFCHSMGGGTGSGMGALVMSKLREEYPDKMMSSFAVFPSHKSREIVVDAYNSVFATNQLLESAHQVFCFDNAQLNNLCHDLLHIDQVSNSHLNQIASSVMSGATAALRFPGQLNSDFRRLAYNLVPFPRIHFFTLSHAPLALPFSKNRFRTEGELLHGIFSHKNVMVDCDPRHGKYLAATAIFRGQVSSKEISNSPKSPQFVEWIPENLKVGVCSVPPVEWARSATLLSNSTAIQELFKKELEAFQAMWRRKAFVKWYIGEGMDEMVFHEAEQSVMDLICDYQQYQGHTTGCSNQDT